MISAREKRIQLEASLEREENTLKQIKNSMAQSNATTQAMSRSVTAFQKMSDKPIYFIVFWNHSEPDLINLRKR